MIGDTSLLPHSDRLVVIVGPSGAGKDTLISAWCKLAAEHGHSLHVARRTITRPALAGGEEHEALGDDQWQAERESGAFALHWRANGLAYGVRARELQALKTGTVLVNGSRVALQSIRASAPQCQVVLVTVEAAVRAERLRARGREDALQIVQRLERTEPVTADFTLSNDRSVAEGAAALMHWWAARSSAGSPADR